MADTQQKLRPGDAVRLDGHYYAGPVGSIAIIDGTYYGQDGQALICFNASTFRGRDRSLMGALEASITGDLEAFAKGETVSCSGGPLPFVKLDSLTLVGTHMAHFWKWNKYGPGAGNGEHYTLEVPLWSWGGKEPSAYQTD